MTITVNSYTSKIIISELMHIGNIVRTDYHILDSKFPYVTFEEVQAFMNRKFDLTKETKYDYDTLISEFKSSLRSAS